MERMAGQANCSPALMVLGFLAIVAVVTYIYRNVIMETLIAAGEAIALVSGIAIVGALTVNFLKWNRRRNKAAAKRREYESGGPIDSVTSGHGKSGGLDILKPTTVTDEEAITQEADWLAAEGVELAFSPDGKTLKVKGQ